MSRELRSIGCKWATPERCRELFANSVLSHEYFHHLVDSSMTWSELTAQQGVYPAFRREKTEVLRLGAPVDEAFANAYSLERDLLNGAPEEAIVWMTEFMRRQPPGYRHFDAYYEPPKRIRGFNQLAHLCQIHTLHQEKEFVTSFLTHRVRAVRPIDRVPLYLVDLVD